MSSTVKSQIIIAGNSVGVHEWSSLTLRHDLRRDRTELVLQLFDHLVNHLVELPCHLRTRRLYLMFS